MTSSVPSAARSDVPPRDFLGRVVVPLAFAPYGALILVAFGLFLIDFGDRVWRSAAGDGRLPVLTAVAAHPQVAAEITSLSGACSGSLSLSADGPVVGGRGDPYRVVGVEISRPGCPSAARATIRFRSRLSLSAFGAGLAEYEVIRVDWERR